MRLLIEIKNLEENLIAIDIDKNNKSVTKDIYIIAKEILKHAKKVLIVDVDSIFKNDFDWPKTNYGYFPREHDWPFDWPELRVAAGCVYFQEEAINTLINDRNKESNKAFAWFIGD